MFISIVCDTHGDLFVTQVVAPAEISLRRRNPEEALRLVTRAYIKESTYGWNIQSYSQYRKNLDLLEQGPRGIGR